MMRAPTLAEIDVAELRVVQSKRIVRQSVDRTRTAVRQAVTRPSTVALVAVAAGISTFWVARRRRPSIGSSPSRSGIAATAALAGIVRAFIARYEAQVVAYALQQVKATWQKQRSPVRRTVANAPPPPDAANAEGLGPIPGRSSVG